jgi:MoaD family protein
MKIIVRVFGEISAIIGKRHEVELPAGATVGNLTNKIREQTNQRQGYIGEFRIGSKDLAIILNGKSIDILNGLVTLLKDGDEVVIMQPTAGG